MLLILATGVGLALSNCGGSLNQTNGNATSSVTTTTTTTTSTTPTATATVAAILGQMFVVNQSSSAMAGAPGSSVGAFPLSANGDVAPTPAPGEFAAPSGAAFDPNSHILYVSDSGSDSVLLNMADGSQAMLAGPDAQPISNPSGVAVDSGGNVYVLSQGFDGAGFLQVYPPASQDNATPTYTIEGSNTGMTSPAAVAVNSAGDVFVGNVQNPTSGGNNAVLEFKAGACPAGQTCNLAPEAILTGNATRLDNVGGIALDSAGNIWVANPQGLTSGLVLEFNLGACTGMCNLAPSTTITSGLAQPFGIAIDQHGRIYVANTAGGDNELGSVTVYSPGGADLIRTIAGSNTQLSSPVGVAIAATP